MEDTHDISDDLVKVRGMARRLWDHDKVSRNDDLVQQTLKELSHNLTAIHKAATTQLENLRRKFRPLTCAECDYMRNMIGAIIVFCRCSLNWVLKKDALWGARSFFARKLQKYERGLLGFIKDSTTLLSSQEFDDHLERYYLILQPEGEVDEDLNDLFTMWNYTTFCSTYHQVNIIDDESVLEYIDQVVVYLKADKLELSLRTDFQIKQMTFLRKYLEFTTKDRINTQEVDRLLISAYIVASRMAWYSFYGKWYRNRYREQFIGQVQSGVCVKILRTLVVKLDGTSSSSIPPMTDQLLLDYVDCILESLIELQKVEDKDDSFIQTISHKGVWNVARFLIGCQPENVSDFRVQFQASVGEVGCLIHKCFERREYSKREVRIYEFYKLIDKMHLIQEETIPIISACIISDRTMQEYPKSLGYLIFALEFLQKLVDSKFDLIKDHFHTIRKNLLLSISFLKSIENNSTEDIEGNGTTDYASNDIEDLYAKEKDKQIKTMIEKSMVLNDLLKLDWIYWEELNELLISAQVDAFKIARYFLLRRCGNNFHWWKVYSEEKDRVDSYVRVGILRSLISSLLDSSSAPLLTDELVMGYGDCIQDNLIELVKDEAVVDPVNRQFEIFHEELRFLMQLLFTNPLKQSAHKERLSEIKLLFHDLVVNLGSLICLCYNDRHTEGNIAMEVSIRLPDLIEKLNLIQEETIQIISACMITDRTTQEYPLSFLIFVLEFLKKLVDNKSDLITDKFDTIRKNLQLSMSFLKSSRDIEGNSTTNYASSESIEDLDNGEKDKQINTLLEKSMFLINYLKSERINGEELNDLLISAQVAAFNIARYFLLRRCGNNFQWWMVYSKTKDRVVDSHVRVGILRALALSSLDSFSAPLLTDELRMVYGQCIQDNLIELVKDKTAIDPLVKDQFEILHEIIPRLMHLLFTYQPKHSALEERLSEIKLRVHALVMTLGSVIHLYYNDLQTKGNTTMEQLRIRLIDLINDLTLILPDTLCILSLVVLNRIGVESPETDQLGYFNILLESCKELMECKSDLIMTWKDQFQTIHEILCHFRSFIQNVKNNGASVADDESQNLCNCIMDAGYVAEYLLSSFAEGSCPVWLIPLWMSEFTEQIKLINAAINEKNANDKEIRDVGGKEHPSQVSSKALIVPTATATNANMYPSHDVYSQALLVPTSTDVVVGFEVEMELIREQLAGFRKEQDVISIIGMPGLGKTTLARKAYDDPFTQKHFDVRAWCCVSQDCNKKEVFLIILGSIIEVTDLIRRKSETDLSTMVHKQLKGRRYLIVLDDVWEMDAFVGLKRFFPDDGNRSRIMLTSRSKEIGSDAKCHSDPIELGLLTDEVSWDLLERKVYGERKCPSELRLVGEEIARKCKGLPLSVVVVAGILAKSVQKISLWEQVAGNLSSYLAQDSQSHWMAALELSYKFLPDYLKPLFLYLGAFPEDKEIPADKLMWLWIAEGFVRKTESRSLEIQAELNLKDLTDRSLVMVAKRKSDGRVKACRVHDLLRDMCLAKSKEDNFMQQIHVSPRGEILDRVAYHRRLSILQKCDTTAFLSSLVRKLSINPPLHTLLSFNMKDNLNSVFSRLKLLRVLHSEGTIISSNASDDVITLVLLRYVSIQTVWNIIPPSISSISTLETLIIKGVRGEIVVPNQIWEMVLLRHLHINPRACFNIAPEDTSKLENLVTLSTPVIDLAEEEKMIRKVPNVKKLSCIFTEGRNRSYRNSYRFPNLEPLCKLESLKVSYYGGVKCTGQFKLPSTLKKLSLSKFRLKWSEISMFQELINLEVLKLCDSSVQDDFWDTGEDDEFTNLKLLKLENLNIKRWSACSQNFPSLEKVVLERCKKLEEIPSEIGEFVTLQKIEVLWCNPSAAKMAKEIEEEQKENGNESLKFHIYPTPQMD